MPNFISSLPVPESIPKAELHVHFEGTVDRPTLRELARRNGINLLSSSKLQGFPEIPPPPERLFHAPFEGTFFDFIQYYVKITSSIKTEADFELIADAYGSKARAENIRAVEMYFTPSTFLGLGCREDLLLRGLQRAEQILRDDHSIACGWIFDIVRNAGSLGRESLELALRFRDAGVRVSAMGLAGLEAGYPPAPFGAVLGDAKKEGFRVYVHAGETAGAESIWETLRCIAPDRIGHGVRAVEDIELLKELAQQKIPLEVCPWSNLALGVYSREEHPLRQLADAGLDLVLGSDDPGIFGKSLSENYHFALEQGFSWGELEGLGARSLSLAEHLLK